MSSHQMNFAPYDQSRPEEKSQDITQKWIIKSKNA